MSSSFLIGQYVEANSILHRLDPRTKIVSLLCMMVSFLSLETATSYIVATFFVCILLVLSRISIMTIIKGLKPLWFILTFTFVYHVLFTKGDMIWSWGIVNVTQEGIYNGSRFVWRIVLLVLLASLLTLTTKPLHLAHGLEKLLSPLSRLGVPVEQFSLMIVIAIRFIPTILEELDRILLAQKARGFDIRQLPLTKRIFAYIPIVIPLLFTTVQRAEQLSYAIDARGYGNGKGRTRYAQLHFARIDIVVIVGTVVVASGILLRGM